MLTASCGRSRRGYEAGQFHRTGTSGPRDRIRSNLRVARDPFGANVDISQRTWGHLRRTLLLRIARLSGPVPPSSLWIRLRCPKSRRFSSNRASKPIVWNFLSLFKSAPLWWSRAGRHAVLQNPAAQDVAELEVQGPARVWVELQSGTFQMQNGSFHPRTVCWMLV